MPNLPEWITNKEEWKGWEGHGCAWRFAGPNLELRIYATGHLEIEPNQVEPLAIQLPSPDAARRVADAIAKELGGWK